MKLIAATLILAFAFPALSAKQQDPANFCNEVTGCTDEMLSITASYQHGQTNFVFKPVSAYSGSCFHLNAMYDSAKEHHGAFIFEQIESETFSTGIFSFFAPTDPFQDLSTAELVDWLKKNSSGYQAVDLSTDQVHLGYNSPEVGLNYWFRSSGDDKTLYLIGEEDSAYRRNLIFCRLSAHE